ncbi:hypothetical protein ABIA51_000491 [Erwinia aphidicola]
MGISEMPPQAVTLEPMVQGEYAVVTIRLLGRTELAHRLQSVTLCLVLIIGSGDGPACKHLREFFTSPSLYHS